MANDLFFEKHIYVPGETLHAEDMNEIEECLETICGILNAKPVITGETERYIVKGNKLRLLFGVQNARGSIRYSISYQGAIIASGNSSQREFDIDLGTRYSVGNNIYKLSIEDGMNNTAVQNFSITVLNMEFGFEQANYPNFAIDVDEQALQQDICYEDQRLRFNAGSDYDSNIEVEVVYKVNGQQEQKISQDSLEIDNGVYFWPFPTIPYKVHDAQMGDDILQIDFELRLKIAQETGETLTIPTAPISSLCYCLYNDNYKIVPQSDLTAIVDYQRTIIKAQLVAAGFALGDTHTISAVVYNAENQREAVKEFSGIRTFEFLTADFGLLSAGDKIVKWSVNGIDVDEMAFTVWQGSGFIDHDLICYYNALSYNDGDTVWTPQQGETIMGEPWFKPEYFNNASGDISLKGLIQYVTKNEKTKEPACVRFNPDSFGLIPAEGIIKRVNGTAVDPNTNLPLPAESFTLEIFYKSEYAAENDAPVIASANAPNVPDSFAITQDHIYSNLRGGNVNCMVPNNTWSHVALVLTAPMDDSRVRDAQADIETLYISKAYYNGCLIGASKLSETAWKNVAFDSSGINFMLNGYIGGNNAIALNTGISNINTIRIYRTGLTASEVMDNYVSCIRNCDEDKADDIVALNENDKITQIFFMRNSKKNTPAEPNDGKSTTKYLSGFDGSLGLHSITEKADSKISAVNCTVYIAQKTNDGNISINCLPNADIWLQGTSSLAYPVKNYKIQNYTPIGDGEVQPAKFLPYVIDATYNSNGEVLPGWNGDGDSVYTLKCDYMDQSHRNNTPTAMYYDKVLSAVQAELSSGDLSPAKEHTSKKYRDSIQGFPTLVYYCDNIPVLVEDEETGEKKEQERDWINDENFMPSLSGKDLLKNLEAIAIPVGSYMFNLDKEGAALGFELEDKNAITISECTRYFPVEDYYFDTVGLIEPVEAKPNKYHFQAQLATNDQILPTTDQPLRPAWQINDKVVLIPYDHLECYAYRENNDQYEIYSLGKIVLDNYVANENLPYYFTLELPEGAEVLTSEQLKDLKLFYFSKMVPMELGIDKKTNEVIPYKSNYCISLEGTANSAVPAAATFYTFNEAAPLLGEDVSLHPLNGADYTDKELVGSKIAYYALTLDPRWSGITGKDKTQQSYFDYYQLDKIIKYFRLFNLEDSDQRLVKNTFETLFDKTYCLTYFLQMMAFAQVDNAGKNAMFDSWGEGRLYPRPYDMDTQLGLENKGGDNVPVGAELFTHAINNAQITVDWKNKFDKLPEDDILADNQTTITEYSKDPNAYRLIWYNTRNSRLWGLITDMYQDELQRCYVALRTPISPEEPGIYDAQSITDAVNKLTCEKISGMQYNRDVFLKYLSQEDNFHMIAGDRVNRTQQFLIERFIFLDSIWGYDQTILNTTVGNSNATKIHLQIKSPQYITILLASKYKARFYVDPKMCYSATDSSPGITISLPSLSSDAEVQIQGAQGIVALPDFGNIIPKKFPFETVPNLSILNISGSSNIANFSPNAAPYLTSITFTGPSGDKTIPTLNFSENKFLRFINCSNNDYLTGITLPNPGVVSSLNLIGCPYLKKLSIKNLTNLTTKTLELGNSTIKSNIEELEIDGCENLVTLDFANILPNLRKLTILNCQNLTSLACEGLDALETLNIQHCDSLATVNCANAKSLIHLDLRANKSLNTVYAKGATSLRRLVLSATKTGEPQIYKQIMLHDCKQLGRVLTDALAKAPQVIECERLPNSVASDSSDLYFERSSQKYYSWDNNSGEFKLDETEKGIFDFEGLKIESTYNGVDTGLGQQGFRCGAAYIGDSDKTNNRQSVVVTIKNLNYTGTGHSCFVRCTALQKFVNCSLTLGTSVSSLFGECSSLESTKGITFAKKPSTSIASLYSVFKDCSSLTQIYADKIPPKPDEDETGNSDDITNFIKTFADNTTKDFNYAFRTCNAFLTSQVLGADTFYGTNSNNRGAKITDIKEAFASAKISKIEEHAFDNCISIKDAPGMFQSCDTLKTIPANLFKSTKITSLRAIFSGCTQLSGLPVGLLPAEMSDSVTTVDCRALFRKCPSLLSSETTAPENAHGSLINFLNSLPKDKITSLQAAFQNTGIKYLEDGVFNGLTKLNSAVAMFADNTNLLSLPSYLWTPNDEEAERDNEGKIKTDKDGNIVQLETSEGALLDCSSLFCGCSNLGGFTSTEKQDYDAAVSAGQLPEDGDSPEKFDIEEGIKTPKEENQIPRNRIPQTLFDGLRSRITSLGMGATISTADVPWLLNGFLGAFAGTQMATCEEKTFQNMTQLRDIAGLFASGSLTAEDLSGKEDHRFYFKTKYDSKTKVFLQAQGAFRGDRDYQIQADMFKGCSNLTNAMGAFACTKVQTITSANNVNYLFGPCVVLNNETHSKCPITKLDMLFAATYWQQTPDESLNYVASTDPVQLMLDGLGTSLTSIAYMFANTKAPAGKTASFTKLYNLTNNTALINVDGLYASTDLNLSIPENYLASFASNLKSTRYMFANTNITGINTTVRTQYAYSDKNNFGTKYEIKWTVEGQENIILWENNQATYTNSQVTVDGVHTIQWENSLKRLAIYATDSEPLYSYITGDIEIHFNDIVHLNAVKYTIYTGESIGSNTSDWDYKIPKLASSIANNGHLIIQVPFEQIAKIGFVHGFEATPTSSFFNGCTQLQSVEGMFESTQFGNQQDGGTIPETLFYDASGIGFNNLTSIRALFANCTSGKPTSSFLSDSMLPETWLEQAPAITDAAFAFLSYGSGRGTAGNNVPQAFNNLQLKNAEGMFAATQLCSKATITSSFLQMGVRDFTLTNVKYIFAFSPLIKFIEPFSSHINNIAYLDYAFYNTMQGENNTNISKVPSRSAVFSALSSDNYCWGGQPNNIEKGTDAYNSWKPDISNVFQTNATSSSTLKANYIKAYKDDIQNKLYGYVIGIEPTT